MFSLFLASLRTPLPTVGMSWLRENTGRGHAELKSFSFDFRRSCDVLREVEASRNVICAPTASREPLQGPD